MHSQYVVVIVLAEVSLDVGLIKFLVELPQDLLGVLDTLIELEHLNIIYFELMGHRM